MLVYFSFCSFSSLVMCVWLCMCACDDAMFAVPFCAGRQCARRMLLRASMHACEPSIKASEAVSAQKNSQEARSSQSSTFFFGLRSLYIYIYNCLDSFRGISIKTTTLLRDPIPIYEKPSVESVSLSKANRPEMTFWVFPQLVHFESWPQKWTFNYFQVPARQVS